MKVFNLILSQEDFALLKENSTKQGCNFEFNFGCGVVKHFIFCIVVNFSATICGFSASIPSVNYTCATKFLGVGAYCSTLCEKSCIKIVCVSRGKIGWLHSQECSQRSQEEFYKNNPPEWICILGNVGKF